MSRNAVRLGCLLPLVALALACAGTAEGQPARKVKRHEAFLEVLAPPGARVSINGEDKGAERLFRYGPFPIVKPQRLKVEVTLKGGDVVKRTVLLDAGWHVRLPVQAPGGARPRLVLQTGHSAWIDSASFSPDGRRILTASMDGTAAVWDAATGARLLSFEGQAQASFSPDGKRILTLPRKGTPVVWDAATGARLLWLKGHTGPVYLASYSPDGRRIVTVSKDGTAAVWDIATGARLLSLKGHTQYGWSVSYSPDGRRIAVHSRDITAVWDAATGARLFTLEVPTLRASFSPDGKRILTLPLRGIPTVWDASTGARLFSFEEPAWWASYSPDGKRVLTLSPKVKGTPAVWDASTGARLLSLRGHTGFVDSASYSPDGRRIVTASKKDGTAAVWDAATGARLFSLKGETAGIGSAQFSPDGKRVLTISSEGTAAWDASSGKGVPSFGGQFWVRAFSPDGRRFLAYWRDGTMTVRDAATGARLFSLAERPFGADSASFSPDGKHIRTTATDLTTNDGTAVIWDAATGARLLWLKGRTARVSSAAYSPDGRRLVTGSEDGTAAVWGAATGARLFSLKGHTNLVRSASYSPDGKRIVTASWDRTAAVWDAATGARLLSLRGHTEVVIAASFSPDGKRIITASQDRTAAVWDAATGAKLLSLKGHPNTLPSASFSPDGKRIVTVLRDETAAVWDAATGARLFALKGQNVRASYSPDGKRIVTVSQDCAAAIWDAATGARLLSLEGHAGSVNSGSFSPDGRRIVTTSADGTARLWDAATGEELCRLVSPHQGKDWLVVTPEGLFDGSPGGREKVSYRVGKGLTVVPVDRFFQDFYRPGLLASLLRGERPMPEADFARQRPPLVRVVSPKAGTVERPQVTVVAEAVDQGGGTQGPWLLHNGARVLVPGTAERAGKVSRRSFTVALVEGDNRLEVKAASADGSWESEPASLTLRYERPLPKGELYLVAVGVSKHAQAGLDLKFAAKDARAVADLFQRRGKALHKAVHVTALTDTKATRDGVAKAFAAVKVRARPQDTLVVFLAGHGTMVGQRYYFIPADFRRTAGASLEADVRKQGLSYDVLADHITAVPALRRIMVLDTCSSGGALGLTKTARNPFALRGAIERLARNQGIHSIAAAAADEEAQEVNELGHGLLTYTLLAGLKGVGKGPLEEEWIRPASREGVVDVSEWFTFAAGRVPRLAKKYFGREQEVEQRSEGRSFPVLPLDDR
jgi:WD40 repeat protein